MNLMREVMHMQHEFEQGQSIREKLKIDFEKAVRSEKPHSAEVVIFDQREKTERRKKPYGTIDRARLMQLLDTLGMEANDIKENQIYAGRHNYDWFAQTGKVEKILPKTITEGKIGENFALEFWMDGTKKPKQYDDEHYTNYAKRLQRLWSPTKKPEFIRKIAVSFREPIKKES